jgi:hypothetical protein
MVPEKELGMAAEKADAPSNGVMMEAPPNGVMAWLKPPAAPPAVEGWAGGFWVGSGPYGPVM